MTISTLPADRAAGGRAAAGGVQSLPRKKFSHAAAAMTLIEVILVMLVLGLMTALVAPSFTSRPASSYDDACELAILADRTWAASRESSAVAVLEIVVAQGESTVTISSDADEAIKVTLGDIEPIDADGFHQSGDEFLRVEYAPGLDGQPRWFRLGTGDASWIVHVTGDARPAEILSSEQFANRQQLLDAVDSHWQSELRELAL